MSTAAPPDQRQAAPVVSVIMPTYRRAHVIRRAIESVLRQTFTDFELIVVDDASPDNTGDVVGSIGDPRVRYLRLDVNGGVSRARNAGIRAASASRFLAYLDDDDEWHEEKLERQLGLFDQSGIEVGIVGCARLDHDQSGTELIRPEARGDIYDDLLARRARGYGANAVLVRRSEPDVLYDERMRCLEDAEYMLRLSKHWRADFVDDVLLHLHRDDDGPHLWNHEASLEGHLQILAMYNQEIVSRPEVHAYYCFCIARELGSVGRLNECREWLRRSTAASGDVRLKVWRVASLFGKAGLRICTRFLLVRPPSADAGEVKTPAGGS